MQSTVKVAVIGAGYWGKNLIRNFDNLGALRIICENDASHLEPFREQYPEAKFVSRTEDALADGAIDAVCISTPAETHYDIVRRSLLAGKHVFVEKPLCLEAQQGLELVELAEEKGLTLMVGHLLHYHPVVVKLKKLIADGDLGRLQYIYSNRLNLGKIRSEENILWSFAPHDISLLLAFTGQKPESVTALGSNFLNKSNADVTVSTFSFRSGVSAHIFVSWLHPFKEQKLVIVGDRSMAVFDDTEPQDKLLLFPHSIMWKDGMPIPDKKEAVVVDYDRTEPLREECAHFLHCAATGQKPLTDGREGLAVLEVLAACQQSMANDGQMVRMEPRPVHAPEYMLHTSAVIDHDVTIGKGTKVWHFSHILPGSTIGRKCNIGQNVVIGPDVTIGDGCKIQNNVSVYKGVTLEDDVFCGPSMVFTNVFNPRANISRMDEVRSTLVKRGASIGANATVVCGHTLGRYCFIGAGAVVTKDVPDHALMFGNPATIHGYICKCGEKLSHVDDTHYACGACGEKYELDQQTLGLS